MRTKGGSNASNSVTSLVNARAFDNMDTMFDNSIGGRRRSNRQRGGSIASNSVNSLVNPPMYSEMNAMADNTFGKTGYNYYDALKDVTTGGRKGGSIASNAVLAGVNSNAFNNIGKGGSKASQGYYSDAQTLMDGGKGGRRSMVKGGSKNASIWGQVMDQFSSHFIEHYDSEPAPLQQMQNGSAVKKKPTKPKNKQKPTEKKTSGGSPFQFQNLSDYMKSDTGASIKHKRSLRGGSNSGLAHASPVGLDYSAIPTSHNISGHIQSASSANDILTDASISGSSLPMLSKVTQYGSMMDGKYIPLNYGGKPKTKPKP